ncbi:MAG: ABC transporter permease [Nitrospinaceae bacterium]|jgi:taurine transport system permease protein|nr:ABC transporter permease [Nitrospinaceae bacterium]MBT3432710.1 ABC transporter permease [Nitrospinaceae bacterium]MBT3822462.1 ABC transporter permease [Nitrospinaceae bacterium]MBT4093503.1 ABC transporter permease [Nitrospinaceae bacterium]MBT4429607.1 ABC transporter permease [Nitrospinaceae bacterium]
MNAIQTISITIQKRFGRQRIRKIILGSIPFIVLLTLWRMNTVNEWLPPVFIPPMASVAEAIVILQDECTGLGGIFSMNPGCQFTNHVLSSMGRVGLALIIGVPMGIAFGVLAGMNRRISNALEPIGVFANAISGIAWVPLAIVWFGIGAMTTLFILLNTIFWLVFFNTLLGVRGVPRVLENSVLTLGGNRLNIITQVYIPGALPSIVTGVRMSMGFGWRALIAAEMIGGTSGLGFMIFVSASEYKIEEVFLGVIVIAVIWMITDRSLLVPLEKWTIQRWGLVWRPS